MIVKIDYKPFEKQKKFHDSKAKFRLLCTGAGFGKTAAGVNELIRMCLRSPPGCLYFMAAPTFKMLSNVTIREFKKFWPKELELVHNKVENMFYLPNGVQIVGVAGDREDTVDRVRGLTLAGGYGDEIAMCPEYMHEMLIARMRDPLGSLRIWYTTTPRGFNWLHRLFISKLDKKGNGLVNPGDYEIFGGSSLDNPHTPDEYKETLRNSYVGSFAKQEIYGEFVGFEGLVYPGFSRGNVWSRDLIYENRKFVEFIGGIDFGYTNPSVALLIGLDGDGRAFVLKEIYQRRLLTEDFIGLVKGLREEFGLYELPVFYADPSEPGIISQFNREGVRVVKADNSVINGISCVAGRVERKSDGLSRLYVCDECVNLVHEFFNYRYSDEKEGKPVKDDPLKVDDHAMDALRYALFSYDKQGGYRPVIC